MAEKTKKWKLPNIKLASITNYGKKGYDVKDPNNLSTIQSYISRKAQLSDSYFSTTSKPNQDADGIRVIAVPAKNLPQNIRGEKLSDEDTVVTMSIQGIDTDRSHRNARYEQTFVLNSEEANNLIQQIEQDPTIIDALVQKYNGGPLTGEDGNPVKIATKNGATIVENEQLEDYQNAYRTTAQFDQSYNYNDPATYNQIENEENEEDEDTTSSQKEETIPPVNLKEQEEQRIHDTVQTGSAVPDQALLQDLMKQQQAAQSTTSSTQQKTTSGQRRTEKTKQGTSQNPVAKEPTAPTPPQTPAAINTDQIKQAATRAIEQAQQYIFETNYNQNQQAKEQSVQGFSIPDAEVNATYQGVVKQAISSVAEKYANLQLVTEPDQFERIFQKDVISAVENKVKQDPRLLELFTVPEHEAEITLPRDKKQANAISPKTTILAPDAEKIIQVGIGGATGDFLRQQVNSGIATPEEQIKDAFPNLSTKLPTATVPKVSTFGVPENSIKETAEEIANGVIYAIPFGTLTGKESATLRKYLASEATTKLAEATNNFEVTTNTADIINDIKDKATVVLSSKGIDLAKVTPKIEKNTNYSLYEYTENLRDQRTNLLDAMKRQQEIGQWNDENNTLAVYLPQRNELLQKIEELKTYASSKTAQVRSNDIATLQDQIDQLDRQFLTNNQQAIATYQQSVSPQNALTKQTERFSENAINFDQYRNLLTQLQSNSQTTEVPQAEVFAEQIKTGEQLDRGIANIAQDLAKEVKSGTTSVADAEIKLKEYLQSQREIVGAFQQQSQEILNNDKNFFSEQSNLQRNIDRGAKAIENAFEQASGEIIAKSRYERRKLTPKDEERALVEIIGWKKYDELKEKDPQFNIRNELFKQLAEVDPRKANRLSYLGFESDFETVDKRLYKDIASEMIEKFGANPNASPADIIPIYNSAFEKYVGNLPNSEKYKLSDDQLRDLALKLLANKDTQAALTAAQTAHLIMPRLEEAVSDTTQKTQVDNKFLGRATLTQTGLRSTEDQLFRDSIREDYVESLTPLIIASGVQDKALARKYAMNAVRAALGGTSDIDDGKGNRVEAFGALGQTRVSDFGYFHIEAMKKMSPEERAAYLKRFPDATQQRINTLQKAFIDQLKQDGINIDKSFKLTELSDPNFASKLTPEMREKLRNSATLEDQLKLLLNSLHKETLQKEMVSAEKARPTADKLGQYSDIDTVRMWMNPHLMERVIGQKIVGVTSFLDGYLPKKRHNVKAVILGSLLHPDKTSNRFQVQVRSFLLANNLDLGYLDTIMKGEIPTGLSIRQHNTALAFASEAKLRSLVAEFMAKNPGIAEAIVKYGKFLERQDVIIIRSLARGNVFNNTLNFGANYLLNSWKISTGRYKYYEETGRVENIWRYERRLERQRRLKFWRQQQIRKFKTTWAGKLVTKFSDFVKNSVKKLISKLSKETLMWLAAIGTGIGALYKFLDTITGGLLTKIIKGIIVAALISLVAFVLKILDIPLRILGALGNMTSSLFNGLAQVRTAFGTLQFSASPQLGMINPINSLTNNMLNATFRGFNALQSIAKSLFGGTWFTGGLWSSISSFFAGLGPLGAIGVAVTSSAFIAVTFYHLFVVDTALKDSLDKLSAEATQSTVNPLSITKTASTLQANVNDKVEYTIDVRTPPCAQTLTVEDSVPTNTIFDSSFPPSAIPNPIPADSAIQSIQSPAGPDGSGKLTWNINIKPNQIKGPCSVTTGFGTSNLTDPNAATVEEIRALLKGSPLENPDMAPVIIANAQKYQVNPLLMVGIFYTENGIGRSGIARPHNPATGNGCYNLGGINKCVGGLGVQTCDTPVDPVNKWCEYTNYVDAIESNFIVVRSNIDKGGTTVEKLANKYIPVEDPRALNGIPYANCPKVEPRFEANEPGNCIRPEGLNPHWKWEVANVISRKQLGRMTLEEYRAFNTGSNTASQPAGTFITAQLKFQVIITATDACVSNTASATIGDDTGKLANSSFVVTSVGSKKCNNGGQYCTTDPSTLSKENLISGLRDGRIYVTENTDTASNMATTTKWAKGEVDLIWKLACRMYQAPAFMTYVNAGSSGFEVQKAHCTPKSIAGSPTCPNDPKYNAFHIGTGTAYSIQPNSRLLLIMDRIENSPSAAQPGFGGDYQGVVHIIAHEIAHAAQANGGQVGTNPALANYLNIFKEGVIVSNYPSRYTGFSQAIENHAESVGFYITNGENHQSYRGNDGSPHDFSKATNFTSGNKEYYNTIKQDFFGGIEFPSGDL